MATKSTKLEAVKKQEEKKTDATPGGNGRAKSKWFVLTKDNKMLDFDSKPLVSKFIDQNQGGISKVIFGQERKPQMKMVL